MNCDKYFNQINDYLNNELDANSKKEFENYLKQDSEFEKIVLDIKTNDILLKKLPLVKTKSNFIINLNEKIDEYESNKFSFSSILNDLFSKNNTPKLVGVLSIFVIVSFSMFKISDLDVLPISDNNLLETPQIAINDADSLNDMENDMPILLIGNEK
tara:strand:+ start:719 stop:1189 length:471 start_codon:yes stop_codon:yes gene_type:complete